jgi:hypothetical protein
MPVEIIHFRGSDEILKTKNLDRDVEVTLAYVEEALYGALYKRELTNLALEEMEWRKGNLNILEGRRYQYLGVKRGVAISGSFSAYEYILEGLFRLQIGFDKGMIDTGILMLNSYRSEKSKYGTSRELAEKEVEMLYPTISMPVTIALFDLGSPEIPNDEGGDDNGISVSPDATDTDKETNPEEFEPWP